MVATEIAMHGQTLAAPQLWKWQLITSVCFAERCIEQPRDDWEIEPVRGLREAGVSVREDLPNNRVWLGIDDRPGIGLLVRSIDGRSRARSPSTNSPRK
jgi:hypothetical protein